MLILALVLGPVVCLQIAAAQDDRLAAAFAAMFSCERPQWMTPCAPGSLPVSIQQVSRISPVPYSIPDA